MKKLLFLFVFHTSFLIATQPQSTVTYTGPPLPQSTGNEGYVPGIQTGGLNASQASQINPNTIAAPFMGNVAPAAGNPSITDSVGGQVLIPPPPPPNPNPNPNPSGVTAVLSCTGFNANLNGAATQCTVTAGLPSCSNLSTTASITVSTGSLPAGNFSYSYKKAGLSVSSSQNYSDFLTGSGSGTRTTNYTVTVTETANPANVSNFAFTAIQQCIT